MFPVNAAKSAAEIPVAEGKRNIFFPEEFSFAHASIFEPVRLRLFDSFRAQVLFNLLLA